jgi:glyoxylase-like metal-dependent hydrolase (beta-lactamase superfamily II)
VFYTLGAYENSICCIFDHQSKTCALVNPAWEADLFIKTISDKGYKLTDIWLTHWHDDHINAVDELVEKTQAQVYASTAEISYLQINSPVIALKNNQQLTLGATIITAIDTPGHSAGGMSYILNGHIIVGDSLFVYGAGNCSLPGADISQFFQSMQKFNTLDDGLQLHCGHNYGCKINTTIGEQKRGNAFLLIDNETDFIKYINKMQQGLIPYPIKPTNQAELNKLLK